MGGCSSKPQTSEREGNTPAGQELNLMLSGLKAIDPSNPSQYKGSQHTLQSLFIQHHRDGEDALENAQTLQELLQDSKALPTFENETQLASKDLCKPSSPISVLVDLAQQDAEKCKQTEGLLLSKGVSHDGARALSVSAGQDADHSASLEAPDCKLQDARLEPKLDQFSGREPNLSENISAYPSFHETRGSKAMEMPAPDIRPLDAEAMHAGVNIDEQEVEGGQKSGEIDAESKIVKGPKEELGMEGAVKTRMQAELELEEVGTILGAHKLEIQSEEAIKVMEYEALLVVQQHDDNSTESCLESEKAAFQAIEEKTIEGGKAGLQAESNTEGEKVKLQDRDHIESEQAGVQIEEDNEREKERRQHKEEEVEDKCVSIRLEGEKEKWQDEEMACLQDVVTSAHIEHADVPDESDKEEITSAKKVITVQEYNENEELEGRFQRNEETRMQAAHEGESFTFTQTKAKISLDACEELELDQEKLTNIDNSVKEAALELAEKLDFDKEKLASLRSVNEACGNDHVIEEIEVEEKGSDAVECIQKDELRAQSTETIGELTRQAKLDDVVDIVESLEKESSPWTVSEEVAPSERSETNESIELEQHIPNSLDKEVHEQAQLELSSGEDKKTDDVPLKQSRLEGNSAEGGEYGA